MRQKTPKKAGCKRLLRFHLPQLFGKITERAAEARDHSSMFVCSAFERMGAGHLQNEPYNMAATSSVRSEATGQLNFKKYFNYKIPIHFNTVIRKYTSQS